MRSLRPFYLFFSNGSGTGAEQRIPNTTQNIETEISNFMWLACLQSPQGYFSNISEMEVRKTI